MGIRWVWAQSKRVLLPKGTPRESLIRENPAHLDTRNLEITPLEDFGTMGLTDHVVDPEGWRLRVTGHVKRPLSLTYAELVGLPSIERKVLLICPGFFANHGHWKGVSIRELLQRAAVERGVTHVTIRGPEGPRARGVRVPMEDILSDKVFLAYQVGGKRLPRKHGFPLRLVAQDYYGFDWIKYVDHVAAEKT
jgi:sulfoxide reductase catalytic subunit YedY